MLELSRITGSPVSTAAKARVVNGEDFAAVARKNVQAWFGAQWGAALETEIPLKHVTPGLDLGAASGDDNSSKTLDNFTFDRNYRIALLALGGLISGVSRGMPRRTHSSNGRDRYGSSPAPRWYSYQETHRSYGLRATQNTNSASSGKRRAMTQPRWWLS